MLESKVKDLEKHQTTILATPLPEDSKFAILQGKVSKKMQELLTGEAWTVTLRELTGRDLGVRDFKQPYALPFFCLF